jgi:hypothetical protein
LTDLSIAPRARLSTARRTCLHTTFGTVVYVDDASGQVRHGAIDDTRANAVLVADEHPIEGPRGASLWYDVAGVLEPIVVSAEGCGRVPSAEPIGASANFLGVVWLGRGLIALQSRQLYLCSEPDGRITLSRTKCSLWECFVPSQDWCKAWIGTDGTDLEAVVGTIDWQAIQSFRPDTEQIPVAQQNGEAPTSLNADRRRFARRRVIVMHHRGNLANKMFQYMGALTFASRIKNCTVVNVTIPEWGIEIHDDTQNELFFDNIDLWTWDAFRPHVEELCTIANRSESIRIALADHLQRMEFLMRPQSYDHIFPKHAHLSHELTEDDLLINIRTAEILSGVPQHYTLLPIGFYEDVVAKTGLHPVFAGQLNDSEYIRQLKLRFPRARFVDSQGAINDFNLIRSAKNVVVAVSTFSWLAAWLSEAVTIILPLSGFFNPAHHREIDLLPVDDIRYRYFLFPLNYGLPEKQSLQYHERVKGYWKEISRNQVALLKSAAPFLRVPRENYNSGLPTRSAQGSAITFDPVWYAHRYFDAAMEISEGWFEDPLHHYLEVGRLRGYLPTRPIGEEFPPDLTLANIAFNKRATQSSLSKWSYGSTPDEDAGHAVNGNPAKDCAFHTDTEPNPWWMVDLGDTALVQFMRIFNREGVPEWVQLRASPLVVEISNDADVWTALFRTDPGQLFGGHKGGSPLVWSSRDPVKGRFVRVSIPRRECLHLAEVEIYGRLIGERR